MAAREIKTTLALDGEKKFKDEMDAASRALKLMGLELKLNASEAKLNGESLDNLKSRQEILGNEISKQKDYIKVLSDGLSTASDAYGVNSSKAADYREMLLKANIALNAMQGDAKETSDAIDDFGKETQEAKKHTIDWHGALEKVGEVLKSGIVGAAKATVTTVAAIGTATVSAAKGVFDLATSAGEMADELLTTSAQTGISAETLQEWGYASRFVDVEVSTMTGSMVKMIRQMSTAKEGTGASAEAFKSLGISITDSNGGLRDSQTVFFEAIDALGKVANETERDALAMQIFGKSAQELNPLIKAGSDELQRLGDEAQAAGLVLDEEALGSLGQFDDTMQKLQATFQSTANNVAMIFLPAVQAAASGAQEVMTTISASLRDGFQPEDIVTIGQAISEKISEGMQMISQHLPQIVSTVSMLLSELMSFAVNYLPQLLPQLMTAAVELLSGALQAIKANVSQIADTVKVLIKSFVEFIVNNLPLVIEVAIEIILALIEGLIGAIPQLIASLPEIIAAIVGGLIKAIPEVVKIGGDIVKGLWEGIQGAAAWLWEKISGWIGGIWTDIKSFFGIASPSKLMADTVGKPMVEGMALGITKNAGLIDKAMASLVPSSVQSSVSMDVTRRFNDTWGGSARSNVLVDAIREAMGDQVIILNDREFGRAVRRAAMA